jgi:dienelactone hydrolase
MMKRRFAAQAAAAGLAAVVLPSLAAGQAPPPMGGGYTNVIPIPVDNPTTKAISGALFKPEGVGPFPAVIYMPGCNGVDTPVARDWQKTFINHLQSKGVATLIVDPFTPRGQSRCSGADFGSKDALAALKVLTVMPDIDVKHIFLLGNSWGATASLALVNTANPDGRDAKVAGVIAYYPSCRVVGDPSVPVLVLIGEKDDWTPAATCLALKDTPNFEVVVYPGATHGFNAPNIGDWGGHHMVYDEKATQDAERRADAFMAAHMPPK